MTISPLTVSSPPCMLPLGTSQPPGDKHAVSVSLPTWNSVPGRPLGHQWVIEKMQASYPRHGVHKIVEQLSNAVLERLAIPENKDCLVFPSKDATIRCIDYLRQHHNPDVQADVVLFGLPHGASKANTTWARFYAVIYDKEAQKTAGKFWTIFGDGISTRHAEFCNQLWNHMCSESQNDSLRSDVTIIKPGKLPTPEWAEKYQNAKIEIKTRIASLIGSDNPDLTPPSAEDVFLYSKGMSAIFAVARALIPDDKRFSEAVVFGWPYSDTPRCVGQCGYDRFTLYSQGTQEELDQLESSLASGNRIRALFCEVPSNPSLHTPDLGRIRELADRYDFCVVCDETLGTYVNVDILPYVDVAITSLTKIFNGAGNAMGGSAIVNPRSRHYSTIHAQLTATYQDVLFPADAIILAENSVDFKDRALICSANALALAKLFSVYACIDSVLYPCFVSTGHLYERYRRENGGYGYVLSILFREPTHAIQFYDTLNICKGPSIGTNFSLALPYAQLSHVHELDWAESQGIPKHIVRISAGLERTVDLIDRVTEALAVVGKGV